MTASPSLPGWADSPPAIQFALSSMRPGLISTPYVESNNNPSRYPTSVLHGENEYPVTVGEAAQYTVILNYPWAGYGADQGVAGVTVLFRPDNALAINAGFGTGSPFGDLYGAMANTSKYRTYGQTLDISIVAPDSTVSGAAHIGSIPYYALFGCNVGSLRDAASVVVDLKSTPTFSLKTWINDKTLVHGTKVLADVGDEMVSFAVLQRNSVQTITADGARAFSIAIKAHANIIWEPALNTPFMMSLTMRPPDNTRALTMAEQDFCNASLAAIPVPTPSDYGTIVSYMHSLTKGQRVSLPKVPPKTHMSRTSGVRLVLDPRDKLWNPADSIMNLRCIADMARLKSLPDKYFNPIADLFQDVLRDLTKSQDEYEALLRLYDSSKTRVHVRRDHDEIEYLDVPNRSSSLEKSDRFSTLSVSK